MNYRVLWLMLVLGAAWLPAGCASTDDTADIPDTYQASPEKPEDSHGWGAHVQSVSR